MTQQQPAEPAATGVEAQQLQLAAMDRRTLHGWRNAIFAVFGLSGFALANWLSRTPRIQDLLEASTAQMGWVVFGIAAGSILGLLAASRVVARFQARPLMLLCLLVVAGGLLAAGLAAEFLGSILPVVLGLAVFGAANGCLDVAMNVDGATNERALGRTVMPLFHAAFSIGTMLGAGAGALAAAIDLDLAWHMVIVSVVVVIGALLCTRSVPDLIKAQQDTDKGAAKADRLAVWKDSRTVLIGLIVLGMAFTEGSANDWLTLASVNGHGLSESGGALVLALFLGSMTAGRIAGVKVLDRFGRVPVLRGTAVLAFVGLLIFILVPTPAIAIVGVVLWGLGASLGFPVGMSAASDDPATAAARTSAVATVGYLAFLAGPPLIGFLGESVGLLRALLVVVVLLVLVAIVAPAARERKGTPG